MRLEAHHAIALCIDVQERLFPQIHERQALLQRTSVLVRGLQLLNIPVLVTEQYRKGLGGTVEPLASLLEPFEPLEKMSFSACGNPDVEARVLGSGKHQVVVFGVEAHVCVLQTVLDLLGQGEKVIVVADCVSSRFASDRVLAIERMRSAGAIITTAESVLFEFMRTAAAPQFKAMSAIVKEQRIVDGGNA